MKAVKNAYLFLSRYIKDNITDEVGNQVIMHTDLWNDQLNYIGENGLDEEIPFHYPAVFLDFYSSGIVSIGGLSRQIPVIIDVYISCENYSETYDGASDQDEGMKTLDVYSLVDAHLSGLSHRDIGTLDFRGFKRYRSDGNIITYLFSYATELIDYGSVDVHRPTITQGWSGVEPFIQRKPLLDPYTPPPIEDKLFDI